MVYQGDPLFNFFDLTSEQIEAAAKIMRNINRYERKRRVAARMISAQKRRLCEIAFCGECLGNINKKLIKENESLKSEIAELNEKNHDLEARNADEQETITELNDQWFEMSGEVKALKWAFEHK